MHYQDQIKFLFLICIGLLIAALPTKNLAVAQNSKPSYLFEEGSFFLPLGEGETDIFPDVLNPIFNTPELNTAKMLILQIGAFPEESLGPSHPSMDVINEQILQICNQSPLRSSECEVQTIHIKDVDDAEDPTKLSNLNKDYAAILLYAVDPAIAMQIIAGTPLEQMLKRAYERKTPILGAMAGCNILSTTMIAGYNLGYEPADSFKFGSIRVTDEFVPRGLIFGAQDAVLESNVFQQGNLGRLIYAILQAGKPKIGLGIDAFSGAVIRDGQFVESVRGHYNMAIFDAETYHAANGVHYSGPDFLFSARNILTHLLGPGDLNYDIQSRIHELAPPLETINREFDSMIMPEGTGTIILANQLELGEDHAILTRFLNLSGGQNGKILIMAIGYPTERIARNAILDYQNALPIPNEVLVVSVGSDHSELPDDVTGIIVVGDDSSLIDITNIPDILALWRNGTNILGVNAGAVVMGSYYAPLGPTPLDPNKSEAVTQEILRSESTDLKQGLGLLTINIENQILADNRWGRLYALAYHHPDLIAIGLTENSYLMITPQGANVLGENVVLSLDFRFADLSRGENEAFVLANGLLDIFAPGEKVEPSFADVAAAPIMQATPILPTKTSTPTSTFTPTNTQNLPAPSATNAPDETAISEQRNRPTARTPRPTQTQRPTHTPPAIPPETDPNITNAMIVVSLFAVMIVFIGVWINRKQI